MESLIEKYHYIVSDVDGTIARKDMTISEATYEALQVYQLASNYKLCLASGRLDIMVKEYIDRLNLKMPIISCNGALVRDLLTNEILFAKTIDQKIANSLLQTAIDRNYDLTVYTANMIYGKSDAARIKVFKDYNRQLQNKSYAIPFDVTTDFAGMVRNGEMAVIKILFSYSPDDKSKYDEFVELLTPYVDQLDYVISQPGLFDINAKNINKAEAFKMMCEKMHLDEHDFISYGDNFNDIALAKVAGYPVAMGNGVAEIKKIAWHVTDDIDHDGVAKHVQDHVLGKTIWNKNHAKLSEWKNKY